MKILLNGLGGHMGKEVEKLINSGCRNAELVAGVDAFSRETFSVPCAESFDTACTDVDCIIDFSHHLCTMDLLSFACKNKLPVVIATTGQSEEERQAIKDASKQIPVFFASNYSMGVALLTELAKKTAAVMGDAEIEIIETHHNRKIDAPSGTALSIAQAIKEVRPNAENVCGRSGHCKRTFDEIGIHSVRMGNIAGIHEVIIGTENQTITLKHEAHSRALFAEGALAAAEFIIGKDAGLYDMKSLVKDNDNI